MLDYSKLSSETQDVFQAFQSNMKLELVTLEIIHLVCSQNFSKN